MASANQYLRVVELLLEEGVAGRELLGLEDTAAFISMEDASLAIVIHPTKSGEVLLEALQHQLNQNPKAHHKLIMIGGGAEMRPLLEECQPGMFERRMIQVYQLSDAGEVWGGRASRLDSSVGRALEGAKSVEQPVDVSRLASLVRKPSKDEVKRVKEHRSFLQAYQAVRPSVTIGAVALILGVYGLQMTWGGGEFLPTMVRMGANTETALSTEPWRLLSSTLLHGNFVHVAMNAFVLYILGAHLERILGWRRQLVLLVVAGLVGGIASAVRAEALLSVGASGAIWGLLGAALGIALRPGNIVPVAIVQNLKRAAFINLIINLFVSFVPGVDFMAHFGGGAAGLALSYSGLLTRGLRPVAEDPLRRRDAKRSWTVGAWVAAAATVGSLVVAVTVGRPWELGRAPVLVETSIEGTRYSLRVPEGIAERTVEDDGSIALNYGDPLTAAFSLGVTVRPWEREPLDETLVETWRNRDPALAEGVKLVSSDPVEGDGPPAYEEVHRYPNGGQLYVRYSLFEDGEVVLSAFVFEGARDDVTAAARASIASLKAD